MSKIVDKIQKLLALANSSNEHEAKSASAKANKLLLKHNLSMADIREEETEYNYVEVDWYTRRPVISKFVYPILTQFFFIKIVNSQIGKRKFKITFLGEKDNLEIARYMDKFFREAFKNGWELYKHLHGLDNSSKQSYYLGFYHGICEQLKTVKEEVEEETGLVVVEDAGLVKYQQELFKNLKEGRKTTVNCQDADAINAGKEQGKNLRIRRALGGSSSSDTIRRIGV